MSTTSTRRVRCRICGKQAKIRQKGRGYDERGHKLNPGVEYELWLECPTGCSASPVTLDTWR